MDWITLIEAAAAGLAVLAVAWRHRGDEPPVRACRARVRAHARRPSCTSHVRLVPAARPFDFEEAS